LQEVQIEVKSGSRPLSIRIADARIIEVNQGEEFKIDLPV